MWCRRAAFVLNGRLIAPAAWLRTSGLPLAAPPGHCAGRGLGGVGGTALLPIDTGGGRGPAASDQALEDLPAEASALGRSSQDGRAAELTDAEAEIGGQVEAGLEFRLAPDAQGGTVIGRAQMGPHAPVEQGQLQFGCLDCPGGSGIGRAVSLRLGRADGRGGRLHCGGAAHSCARSWLGFDLKASSVPPWPAGGWCCEAPTPAGGPGARGQQAVNAGQLRRRMEWRSGR